MECNICKVRIPSYLYCCDSCFKKEQGLITTVVKNNNDIGVIFNEINGVLLAQNNVSQFRIYPNSPYYYNLPDCDYSICIRYHKNTVDYVFAVAELDKIRRHFGTTDNTLYHKIDQSRSEYSSGWREAFQFKFNELQIRVWFGE